VRVPRAKLGAGAVVTLGDSHLRVVSLDAG